MSKNLSSRLQGRRRAPNNCIAEGLEPRRLLSAGSLIASFGGTGIVDIPETNGLSVNAVASAIQGDGKIVEVGTTSDHRVAVVRFNTNGTLDSTFGVGGEALFHFSNHNDVGRAIAIQSDGKIIVAGAEDQTDASTVAVPYGNAQVAVARLNTNGTLDTTFGDSGGIFTISETDVIDENQGAMATNVLIAPGGYVYVTGTIFTNPVTGASSYDFLSLRLYPDGKLDHTYAADGVDQIDLGGNSNSEDGTVNDDDLSLASALDLNGTQATNPNYGKLVLVGYNSASNRVHEIGIARVDVNGSLDKTFNGSGRMIRPFQSGNTDSIGYGVVITNTDEIVVAGETWSGSPGTNTNFALMGLESNGKLAPGFGSGGVTITDFGGNNDAALSITIGQTGDLIAAGESGGRFAMAAYTPNGQLDPNLGIGGKLTSTEPGANNVVTAAGGTLITTSSEDSNTEALYDIVPSASIGTLNGSASEQGPTSAAFLVTESFPTSYARVVYIDISGSATAPTVLSIRRGIADYTLSGLTIPHSGGTPYVIIPANSTFVSVTLTPIDDTRVEGDETAIFSIAPNPSYNITPTLASTTITIHDNDGPATTAFNATADAYVRDGTSANTNFGTANQLIVKDGGTGNNRQSYLKFDLSSLSSFNSVKLQLYGDLNAASSTPAVDQLFGVGTTSWSETTITYNNKPASTGSALGSMSIAYTTLNLYTIDVTSYVKSMFASGHKVVSFLIQSSVASTPYVAFNSRENTDGPQLIVS